MKGWQKFLLVMLVVAFPAGLALFRVSDRLKPQMGFHAPADVEAAIQVRAGELADMDLKIAAAQGELLKYQDHKRSIVADLEVMREKIGKVIESASLKSPTAP